jgi:hypothetical protein
MQDIALSLLTNGYTPLRLEPNEKYTKATGWSTTVPTQESISRDFARPSNIGVRLGDPQKDGTYLIAIDIDVEDASLIRCVERAIGTSVPVKRGKKGYTYFVRMDREVKTHKIYLKRNGKKTAAIDVLARGAQTVVPPSVHPDTKKPYYWVAGVPITDIAVNELPVFTPCLLDEIRGFGANEEDHIYQLNDMEWLGAGGGGNTHDVCVSAVSSMVARKWTDAEIQYRIQRAKKEACDAAGTVYNWPEAEKVIQEWIDSSRDKKFDTTAKQRVDDIPIEMLNNYVYVVEIDRMYCLKKNVAMNKNQFDNVHSRDIPKPWATLLCSPDLRICDKLTYSPGQPRFCMEKSFNSAAILDCLNVWTANDLEPEEGDVGLWLDLVSKVFDGDQKAINHVISFLAFSVQYPGQRINHAIVLQGTQGIGKDSIFNAVASIFGSQNVASVTLNQVESQFNDWLFGKQLIIFQEMLAPGRRSIYNKLKTVITDETHSVNMKHLPVQRIYNRGNYVFLTNYKHALSLDRDDRRMWVWYSKMQPQDETYYVNFYKWMADKRSIANLYDYLLKYDTSKFNPTASPYMTADKMHMIQTSSSEVEQYLRDAYENNTWPLASDLISMNHILAALRPIMRVSTPLLTESLEHICGKLGECSVRPRIKTDGGSEVRLRLKSIRKHNKWKDATAAQLLAEYKIPLPPLQGESDGSYSTYKGPETSGDTSVDTGDDF